MRSLSVVGAVLAVAVLMPPAGGSAHAQSMCESMKVKASGKLFQCVTNAYSKAYKRGTAVLPETIAKCETKFDTSCAKGVLRSDCSLFSRGCDPLRNDVLRTGLFHSSDSCVNAPAGLFAWWPFDEIEGDYALDIKPQVTPEQEADHSATKASGSTPIIGKHGLAMSGSATALANGHDPTNLTIDAWVHYDGTIVVFSGGLSYYEFFLSGGDLWFVEQCSAGSNVWGTTTQPLPVPIGVWTHVAFVADQAADKVTFYVNGVAQSTSPSDYGSAAFSACAGLSFPTFELGGSGFTGLDELEIFETALTQAEINGIYSSPKGKCKPPCQ